MEQRKNTRTHRIEETPNAPQSPWRHVKRNKEASRPLFPRVTVGVLALIFAVLVAVAVSGNHQSNSPSASTALPLQITLHGDSTVTLEFGAVYEDPGVQVFYSGSAVEASVSVSTPQMNALGSYTIAYTVTYEGYTASQQRIVEVVDTTAPVITLLKVPGYCPEVGETYQEEGFTAVDVCDGDLTRQVERTVDGDVIRYTVTDASGNTATAERTVIYGDTIAPEITLLGDSEITIPAGTEFEEPGYTAVDRVDGDLTDHVVVTGTYNKYLPGRYTYAYTVTDAHGNTATAERTVIIEGLTQPETVTPEGKVIYLTFDDGPSGYTLQLLEVLEKYNVKATFFVVGQAGMGYLDEIAAGGHAIGIHSYTHDLQNIYTSEDAFFQDFFKLYDEIYARTGIHTTLCRFPGGSSNTVSRYNPGIMTRLTAAVEALGFQYFDWNVDSNDAGGAHSAEEVFENVTNGISVRKVSIVLQHDIKSFSVEAVEQIIQWGLSNGYTFLPLDASSPTCHHPVNN